MATSGNRSKAAKKKNWQAARGEELDLPSGNTALVRRPGPAALLKRGVMPDAMAGMVQDMIATGKGMSKADTERLAKDPDALLGMIDTMDKVLCTVVMQPHVYYHKGLPDENARAGLPGFLAPGWREAGPSEQAVEIPFEARLEDVIYSDDVEFEDKAFIFNYAVGGTRDIARFRRESDLLVASVPDDEGNSDKAE